MDIVLTKMANTKAANFYDKKIVIIKKKNIKSIAIFCIQFY